MKKTKFYHNVCTTIYRIGTTNCEHEKSFENQRILQKISVFCVLLIILNIYLRRIWSTYMVINLNNLQRTIYA